MTSVMLWPQGKAGLEAKISASASTLVALASPSCGLGPTTLASNENLILSKKEQEQLNELVDLLNPFAEANIVNC